MRQDRRRYQNVKVQTAQVDADNVQELVALFNAFKPDLVVNLALPYQDLHIMMLVWNTVLAI